MSRHINIPIFIPHMGCPNQCVFCDQRAISGVNAFDESEVENKILDCIASSSGYEREIAFFGGSFTGIDRSLMLRLLDVAQKYVNLGEVAAIRMSTRPDYISGEIVDILKKYTVSEVELGVQSMSSRVLEASKRGHSPEDTERASMLLNSAGIRFVGQMMIGLPCSSGEDEKYTAEKLCLLGVSASRIYPTVVFRGTELETTPGYTPLSLDEAVKRSADVLEIFIGHGIPCRRIGLCESEEIRSESKYVAGPAHPAMGELVKSEIYSRRIKKALDGVKGSRAEIKVPRGGISAAVGHNGKNRIDLAENFGINEIKFIEDPELREYCVKVTIL